MPVRLQAAHLGLQRRREDLHPIVHAEPPGHERPGHDGAEALDGEDAIDRQPRELVGAARRHLGRQVAQRDAERVQPLPGPRRHRHDRATLEERAADERRNVVAHQLQPVRLDQVGLGEHDQAAADLEQRADREMLARLRHHPLVRRDDEHRDVDAADPGQHVLDEPLVAAFTSEVLP